MSTTSTTPAQALPGWIHSPGLAAANVTVARATTTSSGSATAPVEASTPLGTSQATTGRPAPRTSRIASAAGPRGAPELPVPSRQSTTPAAPSRAPGSTRSGAGPVRASAALRASPSSSFRGTDISTRTSRPISRNALAATYPSPPLFPLPQTTAISPSGKARATTSASPRPARSISASPGVPAAIAAASAARIASASGRGCVPLMAGAPRRRRPSRGCGSARPRRASRARAPGRRPPRGARRPPRRSRRRRPR